MVDRPFEHAKKREVKSVLVQSMIDTHGMQAAGSSTSAMALELLKGINDPAQLQILKDSCATAFVGKLRRRYKLSVRYGPTTTI